MKRNEKQEPMTLLFFTIEQMAKRCGIGENKLRDLIAAGKIDHLMIGRKCVLTDDALREFYDRNKVCAVETANTVVCLDVCTGTLIECKGIDGVVDESGVLVPWPCAEDQ